MVATISKMELTWTLTDKQLKKEKLKSYLKGYRVGVRYGKMKSAEIKIEQSGLPKWALDPKQKKEVFRMLNSGAAKSAKSTE